MTLSKSDFLLYLEAPMHLWARKHANLPPAPLSPFDAHLTKQGYQIEDLAKKFLSQTLESDINTVLWQQTFTDVHFEARTDALVHDKTEDVYDLYEIKSSTDARDTRHLYDAAFQALILQEHVKLRHIYIVTVNSEYVRAGEIDPKAFFTITLVDLTIKHLFEEVSAKREEAWKLCLAESSEHIEGCLNPKTCSCPDLCNPNLPEHSIFEVSGLWAKHKKELREQGILSMLDIPDDFPLKPKQRKQIEVTKLGKPFIDRDLIRHELEQLITPLAFLDYETFNPGIPIYDGYHPYGVMTFQYSLHVLEHIGEPITHFEHIVTTKVDPSKEIIYRLEQDMPKVGTVIAWNKSYEMGCNVQMAELYPGYRDFLMDVNDRMYDLGDPFKENDMYVMPEFKGSWSIKNVLPVLVPELSYKNLEIGEGATAMNAWWQMVYEEGTQEEKEKIKKNLLKYCELDTLAMVRIWEKLVDTVKGS
ncbi:MAG: DUF2779 domain-containing protein [Candidatus Woesebacteria bacterium]